MGDFQANFQRPDTGINTVEGNVAGSRALELSRKRQKEQALFEEKKRKIEKANRVDTSFVSHSAASAEEQSFKSKTVGLVTAEEFKRASQEAANQEEKKRKSQAEPTKEELEKKAKKERKAKKKKLKEKRKMMSSLSFASEEIFEEESPSKPKSLKDPTIDTSFLPDKQREKDREAERNRLEDEWKTKQEETKSQSLEITYSYWDGSGHRRSVTVQKGDSIGDFLEKVRKDLTKDFRELSSISADALLYVKEDLILPQDLTFYDLIATKARGKSGPLFHFDVHDDIRLGPLDARIEKDER